MALSSSLLSGVSSIHCAEGPARPTNLLCLSPTEPICVLLEASVLTNVTSAFV